MNRTASLLVALACGLAARTAPAVPTDPAQIMNEAYIHLVQGDQSLDAGRLDEALSLYTQARDYYQRLSQEFPGFEPRIIQYRKTYCDNQIADIERRRGAAPGGDLEPLQARAPEWTAPTPALAPMAPPPAAPASLPVPTERSVEVDYLKSRIDSLEAELAEADLLQDALDALAADRDRLAAQLADANQRLAERTQDEQEAVQALRADLTGRDEQIEALRRDLESKRQLDQALNDMEAKVNELQATTGRLNEEIKTLDLELDDAEVRADQAELRARQAGEKLAAAEARADIAEQELQVARAVPPSASPAADKAKPAKDARAEAKKPAKPAPETKAAEAPPVELPPVSAESSIPPRPIPSGMTAPDYVRQLLQDGENEAALATVQNARRAARTDMNLALIEGIALIRLQRYNEAAALLIDIAKRNPRNAEVHATLGAAMMGAGFYDEARETLQMAIRLDKNLPECHYNLAQLYAFIEPVNVRLARRHYRNARDLGVTADSQLEAALK